MKMAFSIFHLAFIIASFGLIQAEEKDARQKVVIAGATSDMIGCSEMPGTVLMSFPEKCLQMICGMNGFVEPLYLHSKSSCHCCEHNGKLYKEGSIMPGVCFRMYCHKSKWITTNHVHECCERCDTFMDPHIKTFDARTTPNNWYDVHLPCTFGMVENNQNAFRRQMEYVSNMEMYGVYAKFSYCWAGVTCVDKVTYVDSSDTVVDIDTADLNVAHLNGQFNTIKDEPTMLCDISGKEHQVYAWRYNDCVRLVGSTGIALQICKNYFRILAHSQLAHQIKGLCGLFNYYDQDDHTMIDGVTLPTKYYPQEPESEFINSWLLNTPIPQTVFLLEPCYEVYSTTYPSVKDRMKRENKYCGDIEKQNFKYQCEMLYGVGASQDETENAINACVFDLCAMYIDGADADQSMWVHEYYKMLNDSYYMQHNTIGEDEPVPGYDFTDGCTYGTASPIYISKSDDKPKTTTQKARSQKRSKNNKQK